MKLYSLRGEQLYYPENTFIAFRQALLSGAEGIALDVHMTRDREPIVFQDEALGRLVDAVGLVRHHTLDEIQVARFNEPYAKYNQMVPSLDEYLKWSEQLPHTSILMLKNESFLYPNLEEEVMQRIEAHEGADRLILASSRFSSLRMIHARFPEMRLAWIPDIIAEDRFEKLKEMEIRLILPGLMQTTNQLMALCRENGMKVMVRSVRTAPQVERLAKMGVDGVLTPDIVMAREATGTDRMPFTSRQLSFHPVREESQDPKRTQMQQLAHRAKELTRRQPKLERGNVLGIVVAMIVTVALSSLAAGLLMNLLDKVF